MIFGNFLIKHFNVSHQFVFPLDSVVMFKVLLLFNDMLKQLNGSKNVLFIRRKRIKKYFSLFYCHTSIVRCNYHILVDYAYHLTCFMQTYTHMYTLTWHVYSWTEHTQIYTHTNTPHPPCAHTFSRIKYIRIHILLYIHISFHTV